jgi:hypothetical protein
MGWYGRRAQAMAKAGWITVALGCQAATLVLLLTTIGSREACLEKYGACDFPYFKYYQYLLIAFSILSIANLVWFYRFLRKR